MTYAAPLEEMRFVLDRLAGLPEIAALPGYEDAQPDVVDLRDARITTIYEGTSSSGLTKWIRTSATRRSSICGR
jgi:hypothetical protein